jgi:hypothetical protein
MKTKFVVVDLHSWKIGSATGFRYSIKDLLRTKTFSSIVFWGASSQNLLGNAHL